MDKKLSKLEEEFYHAVLLPLWHGVNGKNPEKDPFAEWSIAWPFHREYRFHPTRKWRYDWADPKRKIALEVEGGIWVKGRHVRPASFVKDAEKYNTGAVMGWTVLRITREHIRSGQALEWLRTLYDTDPPETAFERNTEALRASMRGMEEAYKAWIRAGTWRLG